MTYHPIDLDTDMAKVPDLVLLLLLLLLLLWNIIIIILLLLVTTNQSHTPIEKPS